MTEKTQKKYRKNAGKTAGKTQKTGRIREEYGKNTEKT